MASPTFIAPDFDRDAGALCGLSDDWENVSAGLIRLRRARQDPEGGIAFNVSIAGPLGLNRRVCTPLSERRPRPAEAPMRLDSEVLGSRAGPREPIEVASGRWWLHG